MRVRFIRLATFVFEAGGAGVMFDPMLGHAGTAEPVTKTPNQRRNPLVDLPLSDEETTALLREINVVLVTYTHVDHWNPRAEDLIPKDAPILCQPEDEEKIEATGFQQVVPIDRELTWGSLRLMRTDRRAARVRSDAAWPPTPASWSGRKARLFCTLRGIRSGAPR